MNTAIATNKATRFYVSSCALAIIISDTFERRGVKASLVQGEAK